MHDIQQALTQAAGHYHAGQLTEAAESCRQILGQNPQHGEALHLLGLIAYRQGDLFQALSLFERAVAAVPGNAECHANYGTVLRELGRVDDALKAYGKAIEIKADYAEVHSNCGNILQDLGRVPEAVAAYQKAISLQPGNAEFHNCLGSALMEQRNFDQAEVAYATAYGLAPEEEEFRDNLVDALLCQSGQKMLQWDYDQAHVVLMRALELNSQCAVAYNSLGGVLRHLGQYAGAMEAYGRAVELEPTEANYASNRLLCMQYDPRFDARSLLAEARRWNETYAKVFSWRQKPHTNNRSPQRRLRIGYVSADLHTHPVGFFIYPLLENHDRNASEVFVYNNTSGDGDEMTRRLRPHADVWREVADHSDDELAEIIRRDAIDILVDLSLHTAGNRLLVFAQRPAPIQVSVLGSVSTTGLDTIDYRLTDPYLDPPAQTDDQYSEKSIRLPETTWCYSAAAPDADVAPLPALSNGHITFGCLANPAKISDASLDAWASLLNAVVDSRLLVRAPKGSARMRISQRLAAAKIDGGRVDFLGRVSREEYLAAYNDIDIALDPFPYGGATTTCDAFWMGVPVVTFRGVTAVGRSGVSLACNVGLRQWIAEDLQQYIQIAGQRAANVPELAALRKTMRARMLVSPLMNAPRLRKQLDVAFRNMWTQWVGIGAAPASQPKVAAPTTPRTALPSQAPRVEELNQMARQQVLSGQNQQAIETLRELIVLCPQDAEAQYNLGCLLQEHKEVDQAIGRYREALRLRPAFVLARKNLIMALVDLGRIDQLVEMCAADGALEDDLVKHVGSCFVSKRRLAQGQKLFEDFVGRSPKSPEAHVLLGEMLVRQKRNEDACQHFMTAIMLRDTYAAAHASLGAVLTMMGKPDEAIGAINRALSLRPEMAWAHSTLTTALTQAGRIPEAIAAANRAVELDPTFARLASSRLFLLHFDPNTDATALLREHRLWNQRHAAVFARQQRPHTNDRSPDRKLRIGYVSPNFNAHVVAHFILPLLINHDRSGFEVFCYSNTVKIDAVTQQIRSAVEQWRDVCDMSDQQLAEMVRRDGIDILVDLAMHAEGNRLLMFARKPAPVQVSYLAYASTTGMDAIGYRLTDPYLDPPGVGDEFYSEKSIRLAETYWCYAPSYRVEEISPLPALKGTGVTFGCLNKFAKVGPQVLELWARLLRRRPDSRIIIHTSEGSHRQTILDVFGKYDIDPSRVECQGFVKEQQYLRTYDQIDIALDPFPFCGGTTTCDALWMGVPVVTLHGRTVAGRGGVSILSNVGLTEFIARIPDEYINIAQEWAADLPRLAALRASLRQRMRQSPLMNGLRFARNVEAAYRRMWQEWVGQR